MTEIPIKRNMLDTVTIKTNQAQTYLERANPTKKDLEQVQAHLKDALDLTKAMITAVDHDCFEGMDRPPVKPEPGPLLFDLENHAEEAEPAAEPVPPPVAALPTLGCIDVEIVDGNRVTQEEKGDFDDLTHEARAEMFEATIDLVQSHFQGTPKAWNTLSDTWMKAFEAQGRLGATEAWEALENHWRAGSTTFELPNICTECGIILVDDEAATMECDLCARERETRNEAAKLVKKTAKAPKKSKKAAPVQAADPEPPEDEAPRSDGPAYPGGSGEEQFSAFSAVLGELEDRFCDSETGAGRRDFGEQLKAFRAKRKAWRAAWEKDQLAAWDEINLTLLLAKSVGGFNSWAPATR